MIFPKDIHVENCKCNLKLIEDTKNKATVRKSGYYVDKDDNRLFFVDSFGFRGQYPGESNECYKALVKKINEESVPYD